MYKDGVEEERKEVETEGSVTDLFGDLDDIENEERENREGRQSLDTSREDLQG